jgi:hypothetical protein
LPATPQRPQTFRKPIPRPADSDISCKHFPVTPKQRASRFRPPGSDRTRGI